MNNYYSVIIVTTVGGGLNRGDSQLNQSGLLQFVARVNVCEVREGFFENVYAAA